MKQPAFQMYTGDWMKDPALGKCSASTRGIWIDLLCAMHENGKTGKLRGTLSQLAQIARATEKEMCKAIEEFRVTHAATIRARFGQITVINRRMAREFEAAQASANRQDNFRGRRKKSNASVTPKKRESNSASSSSSSSSISTSVEECSPPTPSVQAEPEFEQLVAASENAGMRASPAELSRLRAEVWRKLSAERRLAAIRGITDRIENGEYADARWLPTLATYLREERWERPLRPKARDPAQVRKALIETVSLEEAQHAHT